MNILLGRGQDASAKQCDTTTSPVLNHGRHIPAIEAFENYDGWPADESPEIFQANAQAHLGANTFAQKFSKAN
ncbi:MAG: hypothetical protein MH252_05280 [Thermosynechococcaceae cyanobacterium MS004]|nr:hypothetical protein [Thermosynechococcaceae cyanobacterium MS004]